MNRQGASDEPESAPLLPPQDQGVEAGLEGVATALAVQRRAATFPCASMKKVIGGAVHAVALPRPGRRSSPRRAPGTSRRGGARSRRESPASSRKFTPTTATALAVSRPTCSSTGSSSSHGWHHDAKNVSTTGRPRNCDEPRRSRRRGRGARSRARARRPGPWSCRIGAIVGRRGRARGAARRGSSRSVEDEREHRGGDRQRDDDQRDAAGRRPGRRPGRLSG